MRHDRIYRFHVRVEPDRDGLAYLTEEGLREEFERCRRIQALIKVNLAVDNTVIDEVSIIPQTEAVCDHCGNAWTSDGSTYNGGCCDHDELQNPNRRWS